MSMDAPSMEMFLESYNRMSLIMTRSLLIAASTGETWRRKRTRRKKRRKRKMNQWKMMKWRKAFSLSKPCQALPLVLRHPMLSIFGSNRGKSLKGKPKSSYTRFLSRKRKELHLGHSMDQAIRMWSGHRIKLGLKGLIFSRIKSLTKWMSPYILRSSKLWMMFCQPSTKKRVRRKRYGTRRKISVTWWRRTRARGRGSTIRMGNLRKRRISSSRCRSRVTLFFSEGCFPILLEACTFRMSVRICMHECATPSVPKYKMF